MSSTAYSRLSDEGEKGHLQVLIPTKKENLPPFKKKINCVSFHENVLGTKNHNLALGPGAIVIALPSYKNSKR